MYGQSCGFASSHVWMWESDIKKAESQTIDTFELWCWRRLFRVPWTERKSNQSTLKEISSEYSLEGLMLKLKLQYFGQLIWRADSLKKTLMLGKIEGKKRRGRQRMKWLNSTTDSKDMNLSKFWDIVKNREAWHAVIHGVTVRHNLVTEQQKQLESIWWGRLLLLLSHFSHVRLCVIP